MPFQPDLEGLSPLPEGAPLPAELQGEWSSEGSGEIGLTISGAEILCPHPLPTYRFFEKREDGWLMVLNTLEDTSALGDDWADCTIYMLALDPDGSLMVAGYGDSAHFVRPDKIDPADVTPVASPFIAVSDDEDFPAALQGDWRGSWQGQRLAIAGRSVAIDGGAVHYIAARLIRIAPQNGHIACSLVLDLDPAKVARVHGPDAMPTINIMATDQADLQCAGPGFFDTMFRRAGG